MYIGIAVISVCLLFELLISIVYFKKQRLSNFENSLYEVLLSISVFGLILELVCCFFVYNKDISSAYSLINIIVNKMFIIYMFSWLFLFLIYIVYITYSNRNNFEKLIKTKKKLIISLLLILFLLICIILIKIPLYFYNQDGYVYSYGPGADAIIYIGVTTIFISFFCLFRNIKKVITKKYYPLFVLVLLIVVAYFLRSINPGIIVINSILSFITSLMYFTIENPDVKIVNELLNNKEIVSNSIKEQTELLFNISQSLRNPIKNLQINFLKLKESNNDEKLVLMNTIENDIKNINYIVNKVLNVDSIDMNKIKMLDNNYNLYSVFNSILIKNQNDAKNGVKMSLNIDSGLPENLYGDYFKIKQIVNALVKNSIKYTDEGFIDIQVKGLVRYKVCRLFIKITDTGKGMSISEINKYLSMSFDLSEDNYERFDENDIGLKGVLILLKALNGSLNINSEDNKTEMIVTIDQLVEENQINDLNIGITKKRKVLLVDDNIKEIDKIKVLLQEMSCDVISTMFGKECIDRIDNKEKFDLIIIDDELNETNALPVLQKLQKAEKFNIPVIIMLNDDKLDIKEYYLKDGFKDYIKKSDLLEDIKKIVEKYI